ncbi:hypothetical protein GH733_009765 [Mirounga leonina]|nr:hypothetical protein GH733_009765 [Mirounga leonina]
MGLNAMKRDVNLNVNTRSNKRDTLKDERLGVPWRDDELHSDAACLAEDGFPAIWWVPCRRKAWALGHSFLCLKVQEAIIVFAKSQRASQTHQRANGQLCHSHCYLLVLLETPLASTHSSPSLTQPRQKPMNKSLASHHVHSARIFL